MNITYSKGEIVWAKISGFPWWPAVIRGIYLKRKTKEQNGTLLTRYDPNPTFLIEFYPDHSHCEISSDKIEKFEHTFLERASTKKKSLIKAIDLAKKDIFKKMKFSSHILYDILGKKRYRERKRSIARNKKRKTTKLSSMFNSEEGEKKEKIQKVIFDDDSEEENEQKKKSNISSQTVSMDHSDDEDNYEEISEERIIKKIQNHLDSLLRIKIEMRGKEAHKQIMSSLDKLSRIFARKNFSLNFDSLAKDIIPILTSFVSIKSQDIVIKCVELINRIRDRLLKELFDFSENEIENIFKKNEKNVDMFTNMSKEEKNDFIEEIENIKNEKGKKLKSKKNSIEENPQTVESNKQIKEDTINYHNYDVENKTIEELIQDEAFINFLIKKIVSGEQIVQKENVENGATSYPLSQFYLNAQSSSNKINKLDESSALLRKKVCLKYYNILKQINPSSVDESVKKNVLFLEYLARVKDNRFGKKYKEFIEKLYKKLKEEYLIKKQNSNKNSISGDSIAVSNDSIEEKRSN